MLFNSFPFIFIYLPITLIGFFWLAKRSAIVASGWLATMSLVFYGWWDFHYIPLLLCSITFNFWAGGRVGGAKTKQGSKAWLTFAIAVDLALLAYFKYANFFLASVETVTGADLPLLHVVLPIGISFFTFTQIAFLVDTYRGYVREYSFVHYLLFVTYFPHLIAGPVLHHKEMMPQFENSTIYRISARNFSIGLTLFILGLAKKVLIADNLAPHASVVFDETPNPSFLIAWGGTLAYTFQLYFDFSGYSDMAIGLSYMVGVQLPLNFASPYKAADISDFWRRWHITLSRFLRDYLYIPLGGNRKGAVRRYLNLAITMLLGGLWHGAGWNYVIWGGLHGFYLCIHQAWRSLCERLGANKSVQLPIAVAWPLTFVSVALAWVFFRAVDLPTAVDLLKGVSGAHGLALPAVVGDALGNHRAALESIGVTFYLGGGSRFMTTWGWVLAAAAMAFWMPNTQQLLQKHLLWEEQSERNGQHAIWNPTRGWAIALSVLAILSLLSLSRPTEFLYFQF